MITKKAGQLPGLISDQLMLVIDLIPIQIFVICVRIQKQPLPFDIYAVFSSFIFSITASISSHSYPDWPSSSFVSSA
mgnify:CR=1 FL=1